MKFVNSLLFVSSLSCAVPVQASSEKSPPDPVTIVAAERLLEAINYDALIDRTTEKMIAEFEKSLPNQINQIAEALGEDPPPPELSALVRSRMSDVYRTTVREGRSELRRGAALIYASRFTVAELEHIAELQKDPVLIKMQAEAPGMTAESSALGRAVMSRKMPELIKDIQSIVEEYYRSKS